MCFWDGGIRKHGINKPLLSLGILEKETEGFMRVGVGVEVVDKERQWRQVEDVGKVTQET